MLTVVKPQHRHGLQLERAELLKLLGRVQRVAGKRTVRPIFSCVQLAASDGYLRLSATDGETTLYTHTPCDGNLPPVVVPCGDLVRRVKASSAKCCQLAAIGGAKRLSINGGRVTHTMHSMDPADFPPVPAEYAGDALTVDAVELCSALKIVSTAVAREPSRYALNAALLERDAHGARLVGTDGRRLVTVELRACDSDFTGQAIVPQAFMALISRLTARATDTLVLSVQRRQTEEEGAALPTRLYAAGPDWLLSTFEVDGSFPRYRDVTPPSCSKFAVDRRLLLDTLKEVAVTVTEDSRMVRVDLLPQRVRVATDCPEIGSSHAEIPSLFLGGGDNEVHTAFNAAFLLDALQTLSGEQVVIDVAQNGYGADRTVFGKPALLYDRRDPAARWVIMPVNAGLPATRSNLGSNYRPELDNADAAAG